jgi:outer membrane protein assembly factor BamB
VKVYDLSGGAPLLVVSDPEWKSIGGLAVDDKGNIYVSDPYRNFVRSYNSKGRWRFGVDLADSGFGIGHVLSPQGLGVVGETLLITEADGGKAQVQKVSTVEPQKGILFSDKVPLLRAFVDDNGDELALLRPIAVTTDNEGRILVLDAGQGKIFRYTAEGVSDVMVNPPEAGGPQNLAACAALGSYKNRVYTLDKATGKVLRWDPR